TDSGGDIYGARVDAAGSVLDPAGIAIAKTVKIQEAPHAETDGTNWLVAFDEWSGGGYDVRGVRVDQTGAVLDPSSFGIATAQNAQTVSSVTFDGTNYFVTWEDARSLPVLALYGAHVTSTGTVMETSGLVIDGANYHYTDSTAFGGSGFLDAS